MSQTDEHPTAPESTDDDTFVVVKKETTGSRDRFNEATYIDGFTRETALVNACKSGDLPRVRALLRQGISIHSIDVNSHTPLIGSVYRNHLNVTKYLLALNANPNQPEHYSGGTALHKAASYGNAPALALLLAAGADVTARERPPSRATPLHLAVKGGHVACVRALLAAGADPRIKDEAKRTAVSLAEEAVAASAKDSDSSGSDDDDDDDEFGDVGSSSASVASAAAEGTAVTEGAAADSSDPSGIDGASKDVSKDSSKAAAKKKKKGSGKGRRKRAAAAILAALQSAASALDAEEGISTDAAAAAAAVAAEAEAEGALMPPPEKKEQSAVQAFLACFR